MLRGTIRDHVTKERRAFLRFFACEQDLSLESPDAAAAGRGRVGRGTVFGHGGDRRRLAEKRETIEVQFGQEKLLWCVVVR